MKAPGTIEPHLIDPEESSVRPPGSRNTQFPELDDDGRGRGSRYWWVWLLVFALVGYGCYRLYITENARKEVMAKKKGMMRQRTMTVAVAAAHRGDMPVYLQGLGTVTAFNTVTVKTRVDGQLVNISFHEGQFVHQGDLLAEIDPRPYEVALEQANGALAQAKGTLERDQAALRDADANYQRYQELYKSQIIAKQQLDTQLATADQAKGSIAADTAAIAGAQAAINSAKLNLTYTKITAPLSGRIGLRLVDVGNMIHASDANGLAVITQLQPISVLFSLPEEQLPSVLTKLRQGSKLPVQAYDREQSKKLADGTLLTVDNQIDATTGTSRLKAVFPNSDNALFPNQFVNARLSLDTKKGVLIVPAVAIQRGPTGTFVYVVGEDSTVSVRPVKIGMSQGNDVEVQDGLAANDSVVVDGAEKLTEGMQVSVHRPGDAPMSGQPSGRRTRRGVE
jgi:membrane fusion protein, multidrug efflux system